MKHIKTYQYKDFNLDEGHFVIEGPVSHSELNQMTFDNGIMICHITNDMVV